MHSAGFGFARLFKKLRQRQFIEIDALAM